MTYLTHSEEETAAVAAGMASQLAPGAVLLLAGDLGAGKTAFVRGLAMGLGIDPDEVSSPTFTLLHEYRGGRLPLYHADLYRVSGPAAGDLGLDEAGIDGVLAVEWPDRLPRLLHGAVAVAIDIVDGNTRRIEVGEPGATGAVDHSIR